ncbi:hypothetical protein ACX1C1_07155 [Paenibacillus sp. strain BS8-2]
MIQVVVGGSVTFAETGTWVDITGSGGFTSEVDIAVDSNGTVYVMDKRTGEIKMMSDVKVAVNLIQYVSILNNFIKDDGRCGN